MAKAKNTDKLVVQNAAKTLLANIRFASVDDPIRTITVTSLDSQRGQVYGFPLILLRQSPRAARVSCWSRLICVAGTLADMLGVRSRGGLYAVLSEQVSIDQAIVETGQKNFYFLDAEPHIPNPADIIVSHRFAKLVKALSAKFQYVIFDAPPVGTFIDAAEIASLTDGALFVVREDFTKREEALNAIAQLKKSEKVKLIGTVMNYCETETSEYYYSYYTKDGKKVKKGSDDQGTSKKGIFTNRANV